MEKRSVKYPCRSCIYFKACGDNQRTQACGGRCTKRQKKADERLRSDQRRNAIENILLSLELGETTKSELKSAIDAVGVDCE